MAKKEISSKKPFDSEIAKAKEEKKQSRGLKSLGDLKGQTSEASTVLESLKAKESSPTKSLPQPPKKNLETLQKQLKETKKSIAVMLTATISLDLVGLDDLGEKTKTVVTPEAMVSLECQGMTSLIRLPPDEVRAILSALGIHV